MDLNLQWQPLPQKVCHFWIVLIFKRNKQQSGTIRLSENIWFIGVFIKSKSASADEREDFTRKNIKLRLANLLNVT